MTKDAIKTDFKYINAPGHKYGQNKFWMYILVYTLYTTDTPVLMKLNNIILLTCFL